MHVDVHSINANLESSKCVRFLNFHIRQSVLKRKPFQTNKNTRHVEISVLYRLFLNKILCWNHQKYPSKICVCPMVFIGLSTRICYKALLYNHIMHCFVQKISGIVVKFLEFFHLYPTTWTEKKNWISDIIDRVSLTLTKHLMKLIRPSES